MKRVILISGFIFLIIIIGFSYYLSNKNLLGESCVQIVVWGKNPDTNQCALFPNPCSIDEGYQKVKSAMDCDCDNLILSSTYKKNEVSLEDIANSCREEQELYISDNLE